MATSPRFLIAPLLIALAIIVAPASAQSEGAQGSPSSLSQAYSENQLKSYAVAALEVEKLNYSYSERLQAARTAQERKTIRQEATEKMTKAIEDKGLTVQTYNEITSAARSDRQLAEKISHYVKEAQ